MVKYPSRGAVTRFSTRSRRRLLRSLACVDRRRQDRPPLFVTLTYPDIWPDDLRECKRDLAVLWKRLTRRFPWLAAYWRIELQERGAPHYHLLLFGLTFIQHAWLARQWYETVNSGDPRHLSAGIEVRSCRTWSHAAKYVAKYLAKANPEDLDVDMGRHWGIYGRANLPRDLRTVDLDWATYFEIKADLERRLWPGGAGPPERGAFCGCWAAVPNWIPPAIAARVLD